jgi:hypothetical protein
LTVPIDLIIGRIKRLTEVEHSSNAGPELIDRLMTDAMAELE